MRRRRKRESFSVSLFPFLAVLICTFGVLIILLVIVVKSADQQAAEATQVQEEEHRQQLAQAQMQLELQQLRTAGLRQVRPELLGRLQQTRNRRAALQAELERLADEAKLLNQQLRDAFVETRPTESMPDETRLPELNQQLDQERRALESQRQLARQAQPVRYSIVPHDGTGGTRRRPIYIECLQDRFVIQPYGIELDASHFIQPIVANNPLDAALVAVREYFIKNKLSENGETPYPLLVVRPSGASAYGLARHAIKSWDEEFGYELIAAEKPLDFGEADPQLGQDIRVAVASALKRQQDYVAQQVLQRPGRDQNVRQASGLQASSQHGGFVTTAGDIRRPRGTGPGVRSGDKKQKQNPTPIGNSDTDHGTTRQADIAVKNLTAEGKTKSLAEQKGAGWALPSKSPGATAYRRPVKIVLENGRMTMDSDSRANKNVTIEIDGSTRDAVEKLVDAIWDRIDSWGVAGVGAYWKPELDIVVLDGGQTRFKEVELLLQESGLEIKKANYAN